MEGCGGGFAVGQFSQQAVEDFNAAIGVHVDNSAQQAVVYIFQCCSFYIEHVVTSNGNLASNGNAALACPVPVKGGQMSPGQATL